MDNSEMVKEWFVTHEGQQFGPVSMDDLRYEKERGALNPRIDLVWKEGMDGWIPSGKLPGLFEKDAEAETLEEEKQKPQTIKAQPKEAAEAKEKHAHPEGQWGGTSRASYLFIAFIFPICLSVAAAIFGHFLRGLVGSGPTSLIQLGLLLLGVIISISAILGRFTNLGMSRLWFLALFVPLLNIWASSRLISCPEGYADHKKLDGIGWLLSIIYWFIVIAILAAMGFLAFGVSKLDPEKMNEEGIREMVEGFTQEYGIELPAAEAEDLETAAPNPGSQ